MLNKKGDDNPVKMEHSGRIEFKGIRNLVYLAVIIFSVFLDPGVFSWVPNWTFPFGIREMIMFAVVYLSYKQC